MFSDFVRKYLETTQVVGL